ncbi:hypothetical protein [Blastococcus sp. CCUG 61487]|uniref:hypothetical protein n=1 Tax=Blastococcus sp. CCUG 61487 TaxID=1840703 RepID=UPI0010BF72A4|nr:hypothetical protein [Blastococcus sp. CCUG 61487]TKJ25262.1 hypothetical protein A6V29_04370 [Blastococcus sp. CCUG 61487]
MTGAQAAVYVLLFLAAWGGLAVALGLAVGRTLAERDRREQPAEPGTPPGAVVELGTRLDVRL